MKNTNSSVSVYMPTHNRAELLNRAVESVFVQNFPVTELIVVDDGSKDHTWSVLEKLQEKFPNLIPIRHSEPKGACASRNSAIRVAKGEFITGLDDDDEILPDHISNLMLNWDDKYSCLAASMLRDDGESRTIIGKEFGEISLTALLHYNVLGNQVLTRTQRLREIGGFDEDLPAFQDYDCWVRLVEKFGVAFKLRHRSYILHTAHELGRISSNKERRLQALDRFVKKHGAKFSDQHKKSAELTRKRILGVPIGLIEALRYLSIGNYRAVISAYLAGLRVRNQ